MTEPTFFYEAKGQVLVIHLPKELDHHNCRNLRYETDLLLSENYITRMVFDFSRTVFMDSSGIGILLTRYKGCIWKCSLAVWPFMAWGSRSTGY